MRPKYLVASALQEELTAFTNLLTNPATPLIEGIEQVIIEEENVKIHVALFTADKMGMPYNSAKMMEIVRLINPAYTFFIGTCASFKDHALGSVLVPHRAFAYESGKWEENGFRSDYTGYDTGTFLRKQAGILKSRIESLASFKTVTDEDICSGAAVIDNAAKVEEIKKILQEK